MISIGDKYILHSENGHDYDIEVVNINDFRPPDMKYACDVYDDNGTYAGDVMFFGEEFFISVRKYLNRILVLRWWNDDKLHEKYRRNAWCKDA